MVMAALAPRASSVKTATHSEHAVVVKVAREDGESFSYLLPRHQVAELVESLLVIRSSLAEESLVTFKWSRDGRKEEGSEALG